jgi:hypothetical protein
MPRLIRILSVLLLGAATGLACGGGGGDDGGGDGAGGGVDGGGGGGGGGDGELRYFPIAEGASWTYQVVDLGTGASSLKSQVVEAYEDIGGQKAGTMGYRLRSQKDSGYTLSWQEDTGSAIVRHREQSFTADGTQETDEFFLPFKMRLDESPEHLVLDAAYSYSYSEEIYDLQASSNTTNDKNENWVVEAVDEEVTVPAGTFTTLRVFRSNDGTGVQKRYWFARGVGKVKEEGGNQREILSEYSLP